MRAGSIRKVTGSAGWKMLKRRHGAGHTCAAMAGDEGARCVCVWGGVRYGVM